MVVGRSVTWDETSPVKMLNEFCHLSFRLIMPAAEIGAQLCRQYRAFTQIRGLGLQ